MQNDNKTADYSATFVSTLKPVGTQRSSHSMAKFILETIIIIRLTKNDNLNLSINSVHLPKTDSSVSKALAGNALRFFDEVFT